MAELWKRYLPVCDWLLTNLKRRWMEVKQEGEATDVKRDITRLRERTGESLDVYKNSEPVALWAS